MQFCSCLLFYLLSITVLHHSVDSIRVQHQPQHVDWPVPWSRMAYWPHPGVSKAGEELRMKLLRLDDLVRMENDVMEPKRKRSFRGNSAPLDRLSVSSMETKQTPNKQSKAVELPRRRINPPPIDRIGTSRLPKSRG
ncbi:osteocrin [Mastacembelus armatus]|nr:osteocrin [Mastacembelus armatus]XP_026153864.1 osteocrin [Mastacembelus armatus]XP_026153872.1 osteocrin [Mastacembelus armatus]